MHYISVRNNTMGANGFDKIIHCFTFPTSQKSYEFHATGQKTTGEENTNSLL